MVWGLPVFNTGVFHEAPTQHPKHNVSRLFTDEGVAVVNRPRFSAASMRGAALG